MHSRAERRGKHEECLGLERSHWIESSVSNKIRRSNVRWMAPIKKSPHSEPSLECSEDAGLSPSAIEGASSFQAAFKRERVMISPIAIQYILETFPKGRVFPSLDRSS